ncbi:MAG: hypothetical protein LLF98_04905 [Clostridium sp.]|uniref:hypothetical protein n=1 Tax=Clostridium sp. TaxID=1506 RepID=UPI0025BD1C3F|nr:hypothetical protein [Clostridium sp.]MCE5220611.1 hypothetical protein [Clostridium sp.]
MLQDVGVREVILQSVVDTKNKYAVYPTEINDYSVNENDMILFALDAAKIIIVMLNPIYIISSIIWFILHDFSSPSFGLINLKA